MNVFPFPEYFSPGFCSRSRDFFPVFLDRFLLALVSVSLVLTILVITFSLDFLFVRLLAYFPACLLSCLSACLSARLHTCLVPGLLVYSPVVCVCTCARVRERERECACLCVRRRHTSSQASTNVFMQWMHLHPGDTLRNRTDRPRVSNFLMELEFPRVSFLICCVLLIRDSIKKERPRAAQTLKFH